MVPTEYVNTEGDRFIDVLVMMKAKCRGFENVKKRLVERGFDEDEGECRALHENPRPDFLEYWDGILESLWVMEDVMKRMS